MLQFNEYRVLFSKTGSARYISHLDLMRAMTRAARRSGIPIWYTEGFNRHPYLTFAAPLSLGQEGLCESMDLRLVEDMPGDRLADMLGRAVPGGIGILSAAPPVMKTGDIAQASYILAFEDRAFPSLLLERESVTVMKRTKKGGAKELDLKPYLGNAVLDGDVMRVTLPAGSTLNINPSLIVSACGEENGLPCCAITRTALLNGNGEVFR